MTSSGHKRWHISVQTYRRITFACLIIFSLVVVTGASVRLTGSGMGCRDWPTCENGSVIGSSQYHAVIESANRLVTIYLGSIAILLAVLGALARRPYRKDLLWCSLGFVVGFLAQGVLGGLTVIFHLKPQLVMGHFLLSMVIVANAVVLWTRAGRPEPSGPVPGESEEIAQDSTRWLVRLITFLSAVVVFLGTAVTGSGPHAGEIGVERLGFALPSVARVHSIAALCLAVLTAYLVWRGSRWRKSKASSVPEDTKRWSRILLLILVSQIAIGYVQYFTGVPVLLVGFHIGGATVVWIGAVRLLLSLPRRVTIHPVRHPEPWRQPGREDPSVAKPQVQP